MTGRNRERVAAFIPSAAVAALHFSVTLLLASQANAAYQRWFDNGDPFTSSEATLIFAYKFLSIPIFFSLHFAGHPAHQFPWYWWVMIVFNSCAWGFAAYILSRLSL